MLCMFCSASSLLPSFSLSRSHVSMRNMDTLFPITIAYCIEKLLTFLKRYFGHFSESEWNVQKSEYEKFIQTLKHEIAARRGGGGKCLDNPERVCDCEVF